jgi:hypothetical protein
MEDLSDFERGQIVSARLAAASVIKIATLLSVSRATASKAMSVYTNHGKTTPAKRNSWRKSTLTERYRRTLRRIVSKNHRTTAAQVNCTELNFYPEDLVSIKKLSNESFTNPISTTGLQLLNLWLLKIMLRWANAGATIMKPGHQTTGNTRVRWSDESSFTLFPTSGRVNVWKTPNES